MKEANSCARSILNKFDVPSFHAELGSIKEKFNEVSVSGFKGHVCVDCGAKLSTFGAVRCKRCNMRKVSRGRQRQRRLSKK